MRRSDVPPHALVALLLLLVFGLMSCGKDSKSPTEPDNNTGSQTIIADEAKVIDVQPNLSLQTITDNTITYSYTGGTPDIATGDVLVSGEGEGYLRRVTGVSASANELTVQTEQAVLTDIIEKGEIDTTLTLDFGAMKVAKMAEGVSIQDEVIDLSNVSLTGVIGDADYDFTITNGSISFEPGLNIGVQIDESRIQEFHAIANGTLEFNFDIDVYFHQRGREIRLPLSKK